MTVGARRPIKPPAVDHWPCMHAWRVRVCVCVPRGSLSLPLPLRGRLVDAACGSGRRGGGRLASPAAASLSSTRQRDSAKTILVGMKLRLHVAGILPLGCTAAAAAVGGPHARHHAGCCCCCVGPSCPPARAVTGQVRPRSLQHCDPRAPRLGERTRVCPAGRRRHQHRHSLRRRRRRLRRAVRQVLGHPCGRAWRGQRRAGGPACVRVGGGLRHKDTAPPPPGVSQALQLHGMQLATAWT